MKQRGDAIADLGIFWIIVVLAYAVVGFLRARQVMRRWIENRPWQRNNRL